MKETCSTLEMERKILVGRHTWKIHAQMDLYSYLYCINWAWCIWVQVTQDRDLWESFS
jgi:hypothetical protein